MFRDKIFSIFKVIFKYCEVELQFKQMINILGIHNNNKQYDRYIIIFISFMDRKHAKEHFFVIE